MPDDDQVGPFLHLEPPCGIHGANPFRANVRRFSRDDIRETPDPRQSGNVKMASQKPAHLGGLVHGR